MRHVVSLSGGAGCLVLFYKFNNIIFFFGRGVHCNLECNTVLHATLNAKQLPRLDFVGRQDNYCFSPGYSGVGEDLAVWVTGRFAGFSVLLLLSSGERLSWYCSGADSSWLTCKFPTRNAGPIHIHNSLSSEDLFRARASCRSRNLAFHPRPLLRAFSLDISCNHGALGGIFLRKSPFTWRIACNFSRDPPLGDLPFLASSQTENVRQGPSCRAEALPKVSIFPDNS